MPAPLHTPPAGVAFNKTGVASSHRGVCCVRFIVTVINVSTTLSETGLQGPDPSGSSVVNVRVTEPELISEALGV